MIPQICFNHAASAAQKNKKSILSVISKIIDSGIFLNGPQNNKLQKRLGNFFKKGYVITVGSGHDSLVLALQALKLNDQDEIIFPVNSYPSAFTVFLSKGKPIPVDCDENGQLNVKSVRGAITKKTKVIIVVHLYGLVGNLEEILKICKKNKIILIEDAAQAFGTKFKNQPVGIFGDIGCFSFYPTKNLGTLGDGGAIWTKHQKIYQFLLRAKAYGEKVRYNSEFLAGHSRLPEIQAGILNVYLEKIKSVFTKRKALCIFYEQELKKARLFNNLRILASCQNSDPITHLFVVAVKEREGLIKLLKKKGIETMIHYPRPVHKVSAFINLGLKNKVFPQSELLSKQILSLPFHEYLTKPQIKFVVKSIKEFYLFGRRQ